MTGFQGEHLPHDVNRLDSDQAIIERGMAECELLMIEAYEGKMVVRMIGSL